MCISLNIQDKKNLQIMQNDVLRYCYNVRLADRVTIVDLHTRAKLSSLEKRRLRRLLGLQKRIPIDMSLVQLLVVNRNMSSR